MLIWPKKAEHYKFKKYTFFFLESMYKNGKMEKTIIKFDDIKIPKQKLHQHRRPILIKIVDTNKIVVSNKVSFGKKGFKYFIGYNDINKNQSFMYISPKNECI